MNRPARRSYAARRGSRLKNVVTWPPDSGTKISDDIVSTSGYSLIVCEKPDAARKVAAALSEEGIRSSVRGGVEVLTFRRSGTDYVVCSALGHLYGVADAFKTRETYPVFDLDWFPSHLVSDRSRGVRRRIEVVRKLSKGATLVVNACDYDAEGETIGENVLRYACDAHPRPSLRARFSTLTKEELVGAFERASPDASTGLAEAGRTRHVLDFIWGVNLSRVLSASFNSTSAGYRTISMGRVQGPTLDFVVKREVQIRSFVPVPYWTVTATFEKDGVRFDAPSLHGRFATKRSAEFVASACKDKMGVVQANSRSVYREKPPPPFDTSELQREAYRVFGYLPSRTLQIAQRLYLDASISYPRTSSQKLPATIGYKNIISKLSRMSGYAALVPEEGTSRSLAPIEGVKSDRAHPAIFPTGEPLRRSPSSQEGRVFDLIVRRFLSCFAEDAVKERTDVRIDVEGNLFGVTGVKTLRPGWMRVYGGYSAARERSVPEVEEGDVLPVSSIPVEEKLESGPVRYDQGSLLETMEREEIGTKSTRAEIISTLVDRGYLMGDRIVATDLGIALIDGLEESCPQIISTELTRQTERDLEQIESGKIDGGEVIERAITVLSEQLGTLRSKAGVAGAEIKGVEARNVAPQSVLGVCPVCKSGKLVVVRSRKTGKRFVGCTGFSAGCKASAPLPQRGSVKPAAKPCSECAWPIVYVRTWRRPWRICVNVGCPSKKKRDLHAM